MATTSSTFSQEADRVHARLLDASRREKAAVLEVAYLLADVDSRQLYRKFTRTSVGDYAVHFGITRSAGHARDLVNMVRNLEKTPKIRAALENGEMDWTKARTASAAAVAAAAAGEDPGSEDRWLKRGREHTNDVLEALAREEQGDAAPIRKTYKYSREQDADVEQTCTMVRAMYGRKITDGEAVAIACRAWAKLQAGGGGGEDGRSSTHPANRIVISRCCDCGKAWRETRGGRVEVSQASFEEAACDSEILDVRDGPARISRETPLKTRRHVLGRDGHRCQVPGCRSVGYLHVHHEGGRESVGHDPQVMPAMCDEHHRQRHLELFSIRGDANVGFRFFREDGTEITGAPGLVAPVVPRALIESDPRSCERAGSADDGSSSAPEPVSKAGSHERESSSAPEPASKAGSHERESSSPPEPASKARSHERESSSPPEPASKARSHERGSSSSAQDESKEIDEDAGRALARLGLRPRETARAVKSAREALVARREDVTLESLLRQALGALPVPGVRDS